MRKTLWKFARDFKSSSSTHTNTHTDIDTSGLQYIFKWKKHIKDLEREKKFVAWMNIFAFCQHTHAHTHYTLCITNQAWNHFQNSQKKRRKFYATALVYRLLKPEKNVILKNMKIATSFPIYRCVRVCGSIKCQNMKKKTWIKFSKFFFLLV